MPTSLAAPAFSFRGYSHSTYGFARSTCVGTQRRPRPNPRQRRSKQLAHVVPLARLLTEHLHSLERIALPPAERHKLLTSLVPLQQALLHARRIAAPTKASPHK